MKSILYKTALLYLLLQFPVQIWSAALEIPAFAVDTIEPAATLSVIYPPGQTAAYEGCNGGGAIRVTRAPGSDTSLALTVALNWNGTAQAGADYALPPTEIVVPAGQFFVDYQVIALADTLPESVETVIVGVSDSCNCTFDTLYIADPAPLSLALSDQHIFLGESVLLNPVVAGGVGPYGYQWAGGPNTDTLRVSTAGTFHLSVTDFCGQTAADSAQVTVQDTVCRYSDPVFIPDGGHFELPLIVEGAANPTLGVNGQGLCAVYLSFDHEYVGDLLISLRSPSGQELTLVGIPGLYGPTDFTAWYIGFVPCSAQASPDPGFSEHWNSNQPWELFAYYMGIYYPFNGCLESFTGPVNGTWTLILDDMQAQDVGNLYEFSLKFCDRTGVQSHFCPVTPVVHTKPELVLCPDALPYTWNEPPFTVLNAPGVYHLQSSPLTSARGCDSLVTQTVTVLNPGGEIVAPVTELSCSVDTILMGANAAPGPGQIYRYWVNLSTGDTLQGLPVYWVTQPGTYVLVTTKTYNNVSCSQNDTIQISYNPALLQIEAFKNYVDCGVSVLLTPSIMRPDWTYQWVDTAGMITTGMNYSALSPGQYSLLVTNLQGCTGTATVDLPNLGVIPDLTATGDTLDCVFHDALIKASSSTPDVSYHWSGPNGFTSSFPASYVSAPGVYSVTVTGPDGCTNSASAVYVEEYELPFILVEQIVQPTIGENNGSIDISVGNAPGPFSYYWYKEGFSAPIAYTEDLAGVGEGTYICVIEAANNCGNLITVSLQGVVGVSDIENGGGWTVSPNPSQGRFTASRLSGRVQVAGMRVYESGGRLVREFDGGDQSTYSIDLQDIPDGVYFLEIQEAGRPVWLRLVVGR